MQGSMILWVLTHLERCKPHQPVQPVVVGRYDTRSPGHTAWFTVELHFLPFGWSTGRVWAMCSFNNYFCTLFSNTESESWYIHDKPFTWAKPLHKPKNIIMHYQPSPHSMGGSFNGDYTCVYVYLCVSKN